MNLLRKSNAVCSVRNHFIGLGLLLLALAGFVRTQEIEKVIWLPDELSGIGYPTILCHNETEAHIYVSDWRATGVVVIDAASMRKVSRYETGRGVTDLVWSRTYNRVYSADFYDSTVTVYDARAGQVVATICGLDRPYRLLLDEPRDKLYVTCDRDLVVVDLATNAVRGTIPIPGEPVALLADTARNRLLVTGLRDSLYFVDPDDDEVIKAIPVGRQGYQNLLALNHTNSKLYITGEHMGSVVVVCLRTDSVTGSVFPGQPTDMVWHPGRNLLYVSTNNPRLTVLDGETDSLVATITGIYFVTEIELDSGPGRDRILFGGALSEWGPSSWMFAVDCATQTIVDSINVGLDARLVRTTYVPEQDMVWTADQDGCSVVTLDAVPFRMRTRTNVGARIAGVAWNSTENRLYTANFRASTVSVVNGSSLTVIDTVSVGHNPHDMLFVPELNKLYVTTMLERRISVVDCATNRVVANLPGRGPTNYFAYSPTSDKVYCSVYSRPERPDSSVVIVIDGSANEILTEITTAPGTTRMLWYPDSNWMYVTRSRSIWVLDCETDSVVSVIPGLSGPTSMALNAGNNSIYAAHGRSSGPPYELLIIDAPTRQIRKRLSLDERPYPITWNATRNEIYVGSLMGAGKVYIVDCETDSLVTTIAGFGGYIVDIIWNHIEDRLYVSDIIGNSVYIVDVPTRRVTGTIAIRDWPLAMAWDPVTNRTYIPAWEGSNVTALRGVAPGIAGSPGLPAVHRLPGPTIVRGVLMLPGLGTPGAGHNQFPGAGHDQFRPGEIGSCPKSVTQLLDISGRKVMELQPGENDVRHLAPGVYFIRAALWERSQGRDFIRKVVIQR